MLPEARETAAAPQPVALVTGAAGFIGAALARELAARGWRVCALDDLSSGRRERLGAQPGLEFVQADVRDTRRLAELLAAQRPAAIFHLAARVGVRRVLADPEGCRAENLAGVASLAAALEASAGGVAPRLFFASTS